MKLSEILAEAVIKPEATSEIMTGLLDLRDQVISRGLLSRLSSLWNTARILSILNNAPFAKKYGIEFRALPPESSIRIKARRVLGLVGGGGSYMYNKFTGQPMGIEVLLSRELGRLMKSKESWHNAVIEIIHTIDHELVHREQHRRGRAKNPLAIPKPTSSKGDQQKYYGDPREIMAYAREAAQQLMLNGVSRRALIRLMQDPSMLAEPSLLSFSPAVYQYRKTFSPNHPVYRKFVRYVVDYLKDEEPMAEATDALQAFRTMMYPGKADYDTRPLATRKGPGIFIWDDEGDVVIRLIDVPSIENYYARLDRIQKQSTSGEKAIDALFNTGSGHPLGAEELLRHKDKVEKAEYVPFTTWYNSVHNWYRSGQDDYEPLHQHLHL